MLNSSYARIAGAIGMAGAALSLVIGIVLRSLGLDELSSGPFWVASELAAFTALAAINIGFLGLIWGGAFRGRFGTFAVLTHVAAYTLIVLGGVVVLLLNGADSPLYLLFPIGGALEGIAAMLLIVAVLTTARWQGWQRWIPLLYGVYELLAVGLPIVLGATPNGPSFSVEIGTSVWWFLVGLAVYTMAAQTAAPRASAVAGAG